MSYYDTIDEDLKRAREILDKGKARPEEFTGHGTQLSPELVAHMVKQSGTIYGADVYAAYKLLESLVAEVDRLREDSLLQRSVSQQAVLDAVAERDAAQAKLAEADLARSDPTNTVPPCPTCSRTETVFEIFRPEVYEFKFYCRVCQQGFN